MRIEIRYLKMFLKKLRVNLMKNIKNYQKIIKKKIKLNIGKDVYQLIDKKNNPKKLFKNKKQMLNFFNFKNQHTVLILAHEYTDGNLSQSWNLYENDMFWLTDTLRKIKN